jgi:glucosamine kinase
MSGEFYLGIDGGASRCRARIRDSAGACLGEGLAGPANSRLGLEAALGEIEAAARMAARQAGLGEDSLGKLHAGLGLAGVTSPAEAAVVRAAPHPFASVAVDNDAYVAWLGAFGGADGAILIVGTGSCGLAVIGGRRINVGGWGDVVGDDGSGNQLGRAALRRALWALEGLAPASGLSEAILQRFERDPERIIAWAAEASRADFATFAPLIFEHARQRDPLAMALIAESAEHVARLAGRLLDLGAPRLALIGGLAGPITPWLPPPLQARIVAPAADSADGAISMARAALMARAARKARS